MKGGEYTVYNWNDVDSPSVEVRRTVQTLTMEVSQIMKVRRGLGVGGEALCCSLLPTTGHSNSCAAGAGALLCALT